jgi:hypothetical protein
LCFDEYTGAVRLPQQHVRVLGFQISEIHFPLMKPTTSVADRSSAIVTETRFCRNSTAVGFSPSTIY